MFARRKHPRLRGEDLIDRLVKVDRRKHPRLRGEDTLKPGHTDRP